MGPLVEVVVAAAVVGGWCREGKEEGVGKGARFLF